MKLLIAEKPSVARSFASVLGATAQCDGYMKGSDWIVTWALGHLITMSYPAKYDPKYEKWDLDTLPFLPETYLYELIPGANARQFKVVKTLFNSPDVDEIYNAGDAGREGEVIQRRIYTMSGCKKPVRRVWIDSQTNEEMLRGIREAKPSSDYDNLASAGEARAQEDYLVGMNYSRLLTKRFGGKVPEDPRTKKRPPIAVGRVMTCTLGMIVDREREIRNFVATPYFGINADVSGVSFAWKAKKGSAFFESPFLYDETGFKKKEDAGKLLSAFNRDKHLTVHSIEKKEEKKNPPYLYNLADLQADGTKVLKLSPSDTLAIAQKLYEAKLTTYPRTDARVLSSAVAKEIAKNLSGLARGSYNEDIAQNILDSGSYKAIGKTKYVDDKKVTDHYAIIPTGLTHAAASLSDTERTVYHMIIDRFLSIFLPAASFEKISCVMAHTGGEYFYGSETNMLSPGYLKLYPAEMAKESPHALSAFEKGKAYDASFSLKEKSTSPPKRYTSGSLILAMEAAGKDIEDEELRALMKGSGIGTSATRADVIKKLAVKDKYIALNKKTQIITPTNTGECIYDVIKSTIPTLLKPETTASWEKGLQEIETGQITADYYMQIVRGTIAKQVSAVKAMQVPAEYAPAASVGKELGTCPVCGGKVAFSPKSGGIYCSNRACFFGAPKEIYNAMSDVQLKDFLSTGKTGYLKNIKKRRKQGQKTTPKGTYEAEWYVDREANKMSIRFPSSERPKGPAAQESAYSCPKCKKKLKRNTYYLFCDCGFKMAHMAGDKEFTDEEITDLLAGKWTDLVRGMKSRTGTPYNAYLRLKPDGTLEKQFESQGKPT